MRKSIPEGLDDNPIRFVGLCHEFNETYGAKNRILRKGETKRFKNHGKPIAYLKQGIYVYGFAITIKDDDGMPIGSHIFYSDGKWVWPIYLDYYLEQDLIDWIEPEFLDHLEEVNYKFKRFGFRRSEEVFLGCEEFLCDLSDGGGSREEYLRKDKKSIRYRSWLFYRHCKHVLHYYKQNYYGNKRR